MERIAVCRTPFSLADGLGGRNRKNFSFTCSGCRTNGAEGTRRSVIANRASLNSLRDRTCAGRNQPTFGGSLCSSSGQRLSTTARVSSEIIPVMVPFRTLLWIRCKSAGIITLPHTIRGS